MTDAWQERLAEIIANRARRRDAVRALRAQLAAARAMGKAAAHARKDRANRERRSK